MKKDKFRYPSITKQDKEEDSRSQTDDVGKPSGWKNDKPLFSLGAEQERSQV